MANNMREGKRKDRAESKTRKPKFGYYLIVTDTEETEANYLLGLRNSLPEGIQSNLVIKVIKTDTKHLVNKAEELRASHVHYSELWIVFDKDKVAAFDNIIKDAEARGVNVGWSNPCIEIWFGAYFGVMPTFIDSVSCCEGFGKKYMQKTQQEYNKSDKDIYRKLCQYGDEPMAIKLAKDKMKTSISNCIKIPSLICPGTTVNILVAKIKKASKDGDKQ